MHSILPRNPNSKEIGMKTRYFLAGLCCLVLSGIGCGGSSSPSATVNHLSLQKASDGNLQYCDANGNCQELSNPGGCATLTANITQASSGVSVCEVCADASGAPISNNCDQTHVTCTLVTASEPHCAVCAYDGASIVYNNCPVEPRLARPPRPKPAWAARHARRAPTALAPLWPVTARSIARRLPAL